MNTTFLAFPTKDVTGASEILAPAVRETEIDALVRRKLSRAIWEAIGCISVLAFVVGLAGLWGWTLVNLLQLFVEMIPRAAI
jgi:hypothetical protein